MSDSDLRSLREELEIRVVALLTGELSEVDADELEQILTVDAELSAYRDRMAVLIGHVHDARDEIAPPLGTETMRLSPERRAEIFQEVDASEFEPTVEPKRVSWKMRVFEIAAVFAVLFILAGILIPTVGAVKMKSSRVAYEHEAHFDAPAELNEMEAAEYFALQTDIPVERIEGTPQPIQLSKRAPKSKVKVSEDIIATGASSSAWGADGLSMASADEFKKERASEVGQELRSQLYFDGEAMLGAKKDMVASGVARQRADLRGNSVGDDQVASDWIESDESMVGRAGGAGLVLADADFDSNSGPVDPFAAPSVGMSGKLEAAKPDVMMDAFAAPASSEYAGERSKSNADPFAAPATASEKPADLLKKGRLTQDTGEFSDGMMSHQKMITMVDQAWERPQEPIQIMASPAYKAPTTREKLQSIVIPEVNFRGMELSRVVDTLSELSVEYDSERVGINMIPLYDPAREDPKINISLRNLNLDRIIEFVTQQAGYGYVIDRGNVVVQKQGYSSEELAGMERAEKTRQTPKHEKQTTDAPISTFSLNVSDVSFKLAQAALESSRVPDASLIRSEEFVNSFDYRDPVPQADEAVSLNWEIADLPHAHGRQVIRFSLQTQAAGRMQAQPLNLHLLVDNSGSMQRPDRRVILEQSLQSLKDKLQPQDELSIVLFARQPKLVANASTHASQQIAVDQALAYRPEGGTNLEAGLSAAYANAQRNFDPAASNRVILMTDGAANLGDVDGSALAEMVVEQRKQGIALDAFGIGWDDYNDALLEEITRNGDGRYGFLNSPEEASQDFSEKLAGSLRVAAADVKVQVIWNPQRVTTYRQMGYDLHQLKTEDFRDNTVDAAEIGEAEAGTALYVVQVNDDPNVIGRLGTLQVRYRDPATGLYHEQKWPLEMPRSIPSLEAASPALRLATASALFAERLANNPYARGYRLSELTTLTNDLPEAFPTQQRVVELQNMINNARILLGDAN